MRRRTGRRVGRASVVVPVVVAALTACDAGGPAERPTGPVPATALSQVADPAPVVRPHRAAMPEVPLRYMYARGAGSEGVLVSASGRTDTGLSTSAYVPTRTGSVFASGGQVYGLGEGGTAAAIGPVSEQSVFLQVDPTLRYVAWVARRVDRLHARVLVYDVVADRMALDRVLLWGDRTSVLRIATFGAVRLRLVHLPRSGLWTFATLSGHSLVTPGGQVVDLRSRQVEGPRVSRGVWSPGLRYSVSETRGRRPWQVVDLTTGRDLTPAVLLGPAHRATRFAGWLGNTTFGVLASSGTWRHTATAASVCRVAGHCRVVWRLHLGPDDSGLQESNEID